MLTYVCLYNFTDQGLRNIADTTKRHKAFKTLVESKGVILREVLWTLGPYDMVAICDVPDDATATALMFSLGKAGNIRTLPMRAFSLAETDGILAKID